MRRFAWPQIKHPKSYLFMAVLAVLGLWRVVWVAQHPEPILTTPPAHPEWRCISQAKGGPICYRPLPPAAKPAT